VKKKQFVRRFAGIVITAGFLTGWFIHEYFYLLTLFAGLNLLQSSFTGFCPPERFYDRFLSG
jgi:hypothetical protein